MESVRVGFIGLGNMGASFTRCLLDRGFPMKVYDLDPRRVAAMVDRGATGAGSPAEVAAEVDILCSSLPDGPVVREVFLGSGQALNSMAPGTVEIDFSTTDPTSIKVLAAAALERGVEVVDAPVTSGQLEVERGETITLVGCTEEGFRRAEPVLNAVSGGRLHRLGGVGMASTAKLSISMMSTGNVLVGAEAFALGVKLGVDPQVLFDVLSVSGGRSNQFGKRFPKALKRDFRAGFAFNMAIKDIRLALAAAQEAGYPMPVAALSNQLYSAAALGGRGEDDYVGVLRLFESWAGVEAIAREPEEEKR